MYDANDILSNVRTETRYYCFVTPRGLYIGKVETTAAKIRATFVCSIEGNTVTVFGEVKP